MSVSQGSRSTIFPFVGAADRIPLAPSPRATKAAATDAAGRTLADRAPPRTIFALHLVNGEHYSGAERVQDLPAVEKWLVHAERVRREIVEQRPPADAAAQIDHYLYGHPKRPE